MKKFIWEEFCIFINNLLIVLSAFTSYDIYINNPTITGYIVSAIVGLFGIYLLSNNMKNVVKNILDTHFPKKD